MRNQRQQAGLHFMLDQWKTLACVGFLLIIAACFPNPSEGQQRFTVNVTQKVLQAEEQKNVSLTLLFPLDPDGPPPPLHVNLMYPKTVRSVYNYDSYPEAREYVHNDYRDRLWCFKFPSEGRVECSIADLRLSDSGRYVCIIAAGDKSNSTSFDLVVTAVQHPPDDEKLEPPSRSRMGFYVCVCLMTVAIVALSIRCFTFNPPHEDSQC
ncbi:uncharacterized protein LOC115404531 isoform X1 [Salarias fasciatus]|uniref:uncharacterized protein LOC115404531 isoform X1 n=1 Tax=Salarias fasciatus TaxID=181472 RepID=UPI0011765B5B|nr:uncharacterized protein LOC115404531 isoform X1 [Salarias fasciatus]XP_029969753.1 uncharacterized protein LOC115404531 isoform X1 [Salarias fasciatus]